MFRSQSLSLAFDCYDWELGRQLKTRSIMFSNFYYFSLFHNFCFHSENRKENSKAWSRNWINTRFRNWNFSIGERLAEVCHEWAFLAFVSSRLMKLLDLSAVINNRVRHWRPPTCRSFSSDNDESDSRRKRKKKVSFIKVGLLHTHTRRISDLWMNTAK